MGGSLAKRLLSRHEVLIGSRSAERAVDSARKLGASGSGSYREVATRADAVFLTVPWWGVDEALAALGSLDGKILVDVTNPYTDETYSTMATFNGSSAAEEIQKKQPTARVVKAWNHVLAPVVNSSPDFGGTPASVFISGNDNDAKLVVAALARDIGFDPIDAGPLSSAHYLEAAAGLMVTLAYDVGLGTDVAMRLLRR